MAGPADGRKIALINPGPPGTAGAVIAVELRNRLARYYDAEHVFVEEKAVCESSDWGGEPVRCIPFSIKMVRHWQVHRRMPAYDLYHYQSRRNLGLLRHGRTPGVLTCHGLAPLKSNDVYSKNTKRRFREQFRYVDRLSMVIANSKNTATDLNRILNVPADRIEVIYFGVNHNIFHPRSADEMRRKLGIPADALVILNVGTERKNKNIERLLEVFSALAKEFDNLHLVRVGDRDDFFTGRLDDCGLAARVLRPGRVANTAPYYCASDVYLCMDLHASFGMPNLEAMACGCPVVTSGVEAIPEITADACRLVDPTNVPGVTAVVREVLESTRMRDELRGRGLLRAARFTWEETAKQTADVYKRIFGEGQVGFCPE
jgi:glycosyltransferase involved in cell wall biosynthesis